MYTQRLVVGQEFEFGFRVTAIAKDDVLYASGHDNDEPKVMLAPGQRLFVLATQWSSIYWEVRALLPGGRELVFWQNTGQALLGISDDQLFEVLTVRWPAPTLKMLTLHVRCLMGQRFMQTDDPEQGPKKLTRAEYYQWALGELHRCGINSPERVLQERGFDVGR